jgi:hypothetical protein
VGSAYLPEKQRREEGRVAVRHETEPKLRPTTSDYAPNSSRKRRALRTDNIGALQDCQEDIRLVKNSKDD